jgi:hypothetical protein
MTQDELDATIEREQMEARVAIQEWLDRVVVLEAELGEARELLHSIAAVVLDDTFAEVQLRSMRIHKVFMDARAFLARYQEETSG